jgi:hypothetical protein
MIPVSPVLPGSESIEVIFGANQPEYEPLPAVYLDNAARPVITRWRLTDEERTDIANGCDIVLTQLTFCAPFQPIHIQLAGPDQMPVLLEHP